MLKLLIVSVTEDMPQYRVSDTNTHVTPNTVNDVSKKLGLKQQVPSNCFVK